MRPRPYRFNLTLKSLGRAEAFIKTLQREWAYQRPYSSNADRLEPGDSWRGRA